ncbi:IucA/IucC family siderophore biosynthesis protein [Streptomyces montanus]|uniref:IucA/IucC family siderophore biosynthesis protein n=1 Tax=Streptomyces montanus TaxID=2580423 RepID=A0A5R9FTK4_9ACTN|nr:IucA/IucC family protein [Streptomyces montanus]TLS43814.1 IucA/IucC family siderophore biosynthesis protein [Streptomyces montanus]
MDHVDSMPPRDRDDVSAAADAYAAAPLLNCLLREVAEPAPGPGAGQAEAHIAGQVEGHVERRVYRLPSGGRLLRVRGGRRPADPEVYWAGAWHRLDHAELVKLTAEELRRHTGLSNPELPIEMADSRDAVAAILTARDSATPPEDPYLRSEQSLITGHPCHPAPKARGGGPVAGWLPYAPEAYARFPLVLLGVREDAVVEEGDLRAIDALGEAPAGYRLLPAHPWQLDLVGARPEIRDAFADGRLVRLGRTASPAWPTAAIRTVYVPTADVFVKFSLDVRITNDIRRLWRHDLLQLRRTDAAVTSAFTALDGPATWLSDRGYRTADFAFEELAVLARDGLREHVLPGATPLLAAALTESADGVDGAEGAKGADGFASGPTGPSPLDSLPDPAAWWAAYLRQVVPPALELFARHGVVLEAHLQNTVVAVDADGMPVQALFRDAEGVKLLPDVTRAAGWERLVYCLVVNNLLEIAGALEERYPGVELWPAVRKELSRHDRELPEVAELLRAPSLPGKTNLLLRWTGADGADARYLPLPNPLRQ